jgi:RNA-binding protein
MELTGKQRAYLRSLANTLETTHQIGKEGLSESVVRSMADYLDAHELIKVRVLETAPDSARAMCELACERTGAAPVQVIGSRFVLFKRSSNLKNRKIQL